MRRVKFGSGGNRILLVFIHLQTSLILVSHELAKGINRYYFAMLLAVLLGLIPYYRIRRQILESGSR